MAADPRDRSPLRYDPAVSGSGSLLDATFAPSDNAHLNSAFNPHSASGAFSDPVLTQDLHQQAQFALDPTFEDFQSEQRSQHLSDPSSQNLGFGSVHDQLDPTFNPLSSHISPHSLGQAGSDSSTFPPYDFDQTPFDQASLDPALLSNVDLLQPNATDPSFHHMSSTVQSHSPTPPHLLPGMSYHSNSPSPRASPSPSPSPFAVMARPRKPSESLDPSSAAFPQAHTTDWSNMGAYRGHRRVPSDNLSDISSHSNQASPYMGTLDAFDANAHSSPMLNAAQDPIFGDALGIGQFSLTDQLSPHNSYHSPAHSPHISPHLLPQQQSMPPFIADNNYNLDATMGVQFGQSQTGLDTFPTTAQESFPSITQGQSPGDMGQADHLSPPEIKFEFAPPTKPMENLRPANMDDSLIPPVQGKRPRAVSDPYTGSRRGTQAFTGRGRSPSLQPSITADSLSPFDGSAPSSRSPSPHDRNGSSTNRGRSSSTASDQHQSVVEGIRRERSPSNAGTVDNKRQKNPATFQCSLCPKRFTRAYNLRSHLRTHTDERPFVCTVCGKAFARQHDRKRHEGLHSGEKKFVCRGPLQSGPQWGCGRRFARADALGRHFRSEAGRVCIKPLLDEEAAERQRAWIEDQQRAQVATAGFVASSQQQPPPPMLADPRFDMQHPFLPASLLQQYPALAGIDWAAIPQGNPAPEEEYSGRSSFDASSGGEMYDELSENEMGSYHGDDSDMGGMGMGMGMDPGFPQQHQQQHQHDLQQHQHQHMDPYGSHQMGSLVNGYENR